MRVMQVVLSLSPGGTERLVLDLVESMSSPDDAIVCCLDTRGRWGDELMSSGVPVHELRRGPGFRPALSRSILALARAHRVDVLHCHQYTPFVYGSLASLGPWAPGLVFTEHGRLSDAPPSQKRRWANAFLSRTPGAVLCAVSEDVRRHMSAEGLPHDRIEVIHNGIPPGREPTPSDRLAARHTLDVGREDSLVIGTAARLDPVKDLECLLKAFSLVRQRRDAVLVLVGDGPEREHLERSAAELGVRDHTRFMGYRTDVRHLLAGLDVYVNSSISEGISLTILEAMASMLPVVATAVGGTPEIIDQSVGALIPPRNADALSAAILHIGESGAARQTLGAAARRRVVDRFSLARMTARYHQLYRTLAGDPALGNSSTTGASGSSDRSAVGRV